MQFWRSIHSCTLSFPLVSSHSSPTFFFLLYFTFSPSFSVIKYPFSSHSFCFFLYLFSALPLHSFPISSLSPSLLLTLPPPQFPPPMSHLKALPYLLEWKSSFTICLIKCAFNPIEGYFVLKYFIILFPHSFIGCGTLPRSLSFSV